MYSIVRVTSVSRIVEEVFNKEEEAIVCCMLKEQAANKPDYVHYVVTEDIYPHARNK